MTELEDTETTTLETELRNCLLLAYQDINKKTEKTAEDTAILTLIEKLGMEISSEEVLEKYDDYISNIQKLLGADEDLNKKEIATQLAKNMTTIYVSGLDVSIVDDMDIDEDGVYINWINSKDEEKKNYIFSLKNISKDSKIRENKVYLLNNIKELFTDYLTLYPVSYQRRANGQASLDDI